ncbi:ATP-dependent DNA helicase Q-like 4B [Glycine max]|nr:ATP-dependent DNA helicase Q-like 4B [Glycine max]
MVLLGSLQPCIVFFSLTSDSRYGIPKIPIDHKRKIKLKKRSKLKLLKCKRKFILHIISIPFLLYDFGSWGSYCEKDVDCRRLLQLAHFGEKFNSSTCQKTCDNCLKITSFIENDVREIAKQLVWEKFLSIYFFHPSTYLISF